MKVRRAAAVAALGSLLAAAAPASADTGCWRERELDSVRVRAFQTMLMVGALQCRSYYQPAADAYNWFVEQQRDHLHRHARTVARHFERELGDEAVAATDRFNTALANQYSGSFNPHMTCWTVVTMARHASVQDGEGLVRLAEVYTPAPEALACPSED
jgi:hypothetical protein